jgi:coenzyme F420-reducing hydrogenase delta subunit
MENINNVIEKLMLNRTRLMMTRFDKELKEIIENDLQSFKSQKQQLGKRNSSRKAA